MRNKPYQYVCMEISSSFEEIRERCSWKELWVVTSPMKKLRSREAVTYPRICSTQHSTWASWVFPPSVFRSLLDYNKHWLSYLPALGSKAFVPAFHTYILAGYFPFTPCVSSSVCSPSCSLLWEADLYGLCQGSRLPVDFQLGLASGEPGRKLEERKWVKRGMYSTGSLSRVSLDWLLTGRSSSQGGPLTGLAFPGFQFSLALLSPCAQEW